MLRLVLLDRQVLAYEQLKEWHNKLIDTNPNMSLLRPQSYTMP